MRGRVLCKKDIEHEKQRSSVMIPQEGAWQKSAQTEGAVWADEAFIMSD